MICAQALQLLAGCSFSISLHRLDHVCRAILGREKDEPHVSAEVIDHQQEKYLTIGRGQHDGTAEVCMYQLKAFSRPVLCLLQKRSTTVLFGQTTITELVHLLYLGQPTHPFLHDHLPQTMEAQMTHPRVPAPCNLLLPCHVIDRLCNVGDEHI
jgi:hypothetical protein